MKEFSYLNALNSLNGHTAVGQALWADGGR